MENIGKRLLSLAVALVMIISMVPGNIFQVYAAEPEPQIEWIEIGSLKQFNTYFHNSNDYPNSVPNTAEAKTWYFKLTNDIALNVMGRIYNGHNVTIDMAGHKLTSHENYLYHRAFEIQGNSSLTLMNGSIKMSGEVEKGGIFKVTDSYLELDRVSVTMVPYADTSKDASGFAGGIIYASGTSAHVVLKNSNLTGPTAASRFGLGGAIYLNDGKLEMYGGTVTGGNAKDHSGNIHIRNDSTFDMYSGTISNGAATNGGNISVRNHAVFNMYGGTVSGGDATNGGNINIANNATANIYGGTVSGGTAVTTGGNINVASALDPNATEIPTPAKLYVYGGTISGGKARLGGNISTDTSGHAKIYIFGGTIENGRCTKYDTSSYVGGNIFVGAKATVGDETQWAELNIFGGEIKNTQTTRQAYYGGNIYLTEGSTINMYNGTVSGGLAREGGNIYVANGVFNQFDGTVTSGKVPMTGGNYQVTGANSRLNIYGGEVKLGVSEQVASAATYSIGGNLYVASSAVAELFGITVSDGSASGYGGNIVASGGTVNLHSVTVTGGKAVKPSGGSNTTIGGNLYARSSGTITMDGTTTISGGKAGTGVALGAISSGQIVMFDGNHVDGNLYKRTKANDTGYLYKYGGTSATTSSGTGANSWTPTPCANHQAAVKKTVAPTCLTQGYTVYRCEACEKEWLGELTAKTGCTTTETSTAATCWKPAIKTVDCSVEGCAVSYAVVTGSALHETNLRKVEAKAATCEEAGNIAHWTCDTCGYFFSDAKGANMIGTVEIKATGHNYGEWTPVDGADTHQRICATDPEHVDTKPHDWQETGRVDATCTENGSITYTCADCPATKTEVEEAGHSYGPWEAVEGTDNHKKVCTACDTEIVEAHSWEETEFVPSAKNPGVRSETKSCDVCNTEVVTEYDAVITEDSFMWMISAPSSAGNISKDRYGNFFFFRLKNMPTAASPEPGEEPTPEYLEYSGRHIRIELWDSTEGENGKLLCTVSRDKMATNTTQTPVYVDVLEDGLGNNPNWTTDWEEGVDPAQAKPDTVVVYYIDDQNPRQAYKFGSDVYESNAIFAHEYVTTYAEAAVADAVTNENCNLAWYKVADATCTTGTTYYQFCKHCGYTPKDATFSRDDVDTTNHNYTSYGSDADGHWQICANNAGHVTEKVAHDNFQWNTAANSSSRTCATCGYNETCNHENKLVKETVKEDTCTQVGVDKYTCNGCGYSYTEEVDNVKHNYTSAVTKPTCTTGGYTTYTCSVCDDTYETDKTDKTGHSYQTTVTAPTCVAKGYTTYTCGECGDTYTADEVPAKGHKHVGEVTTAATCTEDGVETFTCGDCGDTYTKPVAKLGHDLPENWTVTNPATCTEAGVERKDCSRCDYYETQAIKALGHTEVVDKAVAPTCTETGLTEGKHCSVCGETIVKQEVVDALDHDWVAGEIVPPTVDEEGYTIYTCNNNPEHTKKDDYTAKLTAVAQVGTTLYATLAEALAAAQTNDVVKVLAGEIVFPENAASIAIEKSITIQGAGVNETKLVFNSATSAFVISASNVTIKDMTIAQGTKDNSFGISVSKGAWNAPAIQYSDITIQNVAFVGGDYALCVIGEDVVIDGCTFNDQDSHNILVYSLKGDSKIINNTFNASKGNNKSAILFEGGADNATDLSAFIGGGKLTIDGNEANAKGVFFQFTNWALVEGMELVITDNKVDAFTNKALAFYTENSNAATGREFASVTVKNNVFTNVPSGRTILKEYTGKIAIDASANYLGSETPDVEALLVGEKVTVKNYYTDEALTNLVDTVKPVAEVNGVQYKTLAEAFAAGGNVLLLTDVELTEALVIADGKNVVLDLAGKTLSRITTEKLTKNDALIRITKGGKLTVDDSADNGKIVYQYTGAATGWSGYSASTIENNQGTLTVLDGEIISNTNIANQIAYAINTLTNGNIGDATTNIQGGKIVAAGSTALRQFANSTSCTNTMNISDGEIIGRVQLQSSNKNDNKGVLNITGGSITREGNTAIEVWFAGGNTSAYENTKVTIGGNVTVKGAVVFDSAPAGYNTGIISGGTFTEISEELCAKGFAPKANDDGTFSVVTANYVAEVNGRKYESLTEAFAAVTSDNDTVVILRDCTEEMTAAYLRGNIVPASEDVTITLTNSADWIYLPYSFTIGEGVTLKVPNTGLFLYCGNGVIRGNVITDAYYQMYAGTKLTIEAPGNLTVTSETFILRYTQGDPNAGVYIIGDNNDATVELKLVAAYFYQGAINAKDATIETAVYWQTNSTDNQGSANLLLDNSKMLVTGNESDMLATGNATVTLKNGSAVTAAGAYNGVPVSIDETSSFQTKNGFGEFKARIGYMHYRSLNEALAAAEAGQTVTMLADATLSAPVVIPGVTIDLNGKHLTGDVIATFKMNGGTFETSQYIMAGPTGALYLTNDAVFSMASMSEITVESGSIELGASWRTLQGQKLTIAAGASFKVPADTTMEVNCEVIVDGTLTVDGTVILANTAASIKAAENLNVTTNIAGHEVVYEAGTYKVAMKNYVAEANGTKYETLAEAIAAGGEVKLLQDVEITSTIKILAGQSVTLDLNGKVIDGTEKVRIALMSYGDLILKDSSAEQTGAVKAGIGTAGNAVNICAGSFTMESGSIYSKNNAILVDEEPATITILGGTITAEPNTYNSAVLYVSTKKQTNITIEDGTLVGQNGLLLWNKNLVNITGGSITGTNLTAIQGNGTWDETVINISGDAVISGKTTAIYHPQNGELNISGNAVITGETGVVIKSGRVTISGGTINGTGEAKAYEPKGSGFNGTGDALYVEHFDNSTNSENYGTPTVTVTGGTFNSANAKAVASYANPNNNVEALTGFISGGIFSAKVDEALLAEGLTQAKVGENYVVGALPNATVNDMGDVTINEYKIYNGSLVNGDGTPVDLQIALEFVANDSAEEAAQNVFADYTTDFYIQMTGLANGSFTADGCYLAGNYGTFGWILIPLDGFVVEEGKVYPLITSVGFDFKYLDICTDVKNFKCGIYMTPEVLKANPDLKVKLNLGLSEDLEAAQSATFIPATDAFVYDVIDLFGGVAEVNGTGYPTLAKAIAAAGEGDTVTLLTNVELTEALVIADGKNVVLNLAGNTISRTTTETLTKNDALIRITKGGNLTIIDTVGEGKIVYEYTGAATGFGGYSASTIENNQGTLTVLDGEIISNTNIANQIAYAINTLTNGNIGDATTNIKGGKIVAAGSTALRQFANSTSCTNTMNITGGEIIGRVQLQSSNKNDNKGVLNITGGTIDRASGDAIEVWFAGGTASAFAETDVNIGGNVVVKGNVVFDGAPAGYDTGIVSGGTFDRAVNTAYLTEGYTQAKVGETYCVGTLPNADVVDLGKITITEYGIYDGSSFKEGNGTPIKMQVALQFLAKDTAEQAAQNIFGNYTTDFFIKMTGLANGSFTANGCYLVGNYGTFGWIMIPLDGFVVEEGVVYPVISSVGLDFKYVDICESVKDFKCGIYLTPEILKANPDLEVSLNLGLSETLDEAKNAEFIPVTDEAFVYDVIDLLGGVAEVNGIGYLTLAEAIAAAGEGDTVTLLADIDATAAIVIDKSITLDGNGFVLKSSASRAINVDTKNGSVTVEIEDLEIIGEGNCQRGINIIDNSYRNTPANVTLTGVKISGVTNYGVQLATSVGSNNTITITDSEISSWIALNINGDSQTVTVNNSKLSGTAYSAVDKGNTITVTGDNTTVTMNGGVLSAATAEGLAAHNCGHVVGSTSDIVLNNVETNVAKEGDPVITYAVAKILGKDGSYLTVASAIKAAAAGDTVVILRDATVTEMLKIEKDITIDLGDNTITSNAKKVFEIHANATIKNGEIINTSTAVGARCVNTRVGDITVNLEDLDMTVNAPNAHGINLGGAAGDVVLNMTDCTVNAGESGYAVLNYNDNTINITDSQLTGYAALYMKGADGSEGSNGTVVTLTDSDLIGIGGKAENFGVIVLEDNGVTVNADAASTISAPGAQTGEYAAFDLNGNKATLVMAGTIEDVNRIVNGYVADATIAVQEQYADELKAEGYFTEAYTQAGMIEIGARAVAVNTASGELYNDLEEALNDAAKGETVKLMDHVSVEEVWVRTGRTLDLNGYTLKVDDFSSAFKNANIIDSTDGVGLLKGERDAIAVYRTNAQMPVWDETAGGYRFAVVRLATAVQNMGTGTYNFVVQMWEPMTFESYLADAIVDGTAANQIQFRVHVEWDGEDGTRVDQTFRFTDALVGKYCTWWVNSKIGSLNMTISGAEDLQNITFTAQVVLVDADGEAVVTYNSSTKDASGQNVG